jgi:hypothetical protein
MYQFTTKRMFVSITMLAVGLGLLISFFSADRIYETAYAPAFLGWFLLLGYFASGPLIGAGVLNLAKRPWLGASIGLAAEIFIPVLMFLRHPHIGIC